MSAARLLPNHGCWPALTPRAVAERAGAFVEVAGRACTSYTHTPTGSAALMFDATTSRARGAAATTVTASAVATAAAAVTRVSRRATSVAVIAPSPAQEAAAAAPPSAGRRGGFHYRGQWRQPKRGGPPLRLPPLPRLLTTAHDAATVGAAPPRAHRVRPRVGAPPPRSPFASRGSRPALSPVGGARTVPPRPPVRSLSSLLLLYSLLPTPSPRWRGGGGARGLRRCGRRPTHWRRRAAPPLPTEGASWVQVAARQPMWPASPPSLTSRVPHAVALAGATPPVFRRGGVPPLPPPRRLLSSPSSAAGGPHPPPPRYAPPCTLGRAPPARPPARAAPSAPRARPSRVELQSAAPAPPWSTTRTTVASNPHRGGTPHPRPQRRPTRRHASADARHPPTLLPSPPPIVPFRAFRGGPGARARWARRMPLLGGAAPPLFPHPAAGPHAAARRRARCLPRPARRHSRRG